MKIVIINGSARKGNTLAAINAFIKGASEKNKIEIIEPDKLNIAPCKGCGVCQCSKGCVDKDDTNPTIDKIAAADMILFAYPMKDILPYSQTAYQSAHTGYCLRENRLQQSCQLFYFLTAIHGSSTYQ